MTAILTALATAAGLLLPILIFITFATMAAVRRGEGDVHRAHGVQAPAHEPGAAAATAAAPRELSVIEILLLATALFGLAMLALLGMSMVGRI